MSIINAQQTTNDGQPAKKYFDPIQCPFCRKVFAEWEMVEGRVIIKKWCPVCKKMVHIKKP